MLAAVPLFCPALDGTPNGPPGRVMNEYEQESKGYWSRMARRTQYELKALEDEISLAEEILEGLVTEYGTQLALMRLYLRLADDQPP